jgi:carbon monoxide dehydrogenase subunit G
MAVVNVLVRRPPEDVWRVLADGYSYAQWVPGTREIRAVDDGWPRVSTSLHYTVGVGPFRLRGATTVRRAEPGRQLGLEADGGPLGTARISIDLLDWGEDTVVVLDEHPLRGPGYRWHNALSDAFLLLRGRPMVHRLGELVERRTAPAGPATGKDDADQPQ